MTLSPALDREVERFRIEGFSTLYSKYGTVSVRKQYCTL